MLNIAFEEQTTEIKQVFQVQKKCDVCWRCQVHRVSTSEKNRLKCVSSDGTSTQKQSVSMKLLTCWEFCLCQFTVFGQSEHALDCCEICAPSAEWRVEGDSCHHIPGPLQEAWKIPRIPFIDNYGCWDFGLWVQCRNLGILILPQLKQNHGMHLQCFKQRTSWNMSNSGANLGLLY